MKTLKSFYPQIFGGAASALLISIGGTALLNVDNKYVGAAIFTVALFAICVLGLYLYTGKIGFVVEEFSKRIAAELAVGLLSNFIGATVVGMIVRAAKPEIIEKAAAACELRLENGVFRAFLLGCFCGVLMYTAVKTYRLGTPIGILFCIPVFILAGFEHSIADMYYFSLAGMIDLRYLGFILAVIAGNTVGAIVIAFLWKMSRTEK